MVRKTEDGLPILWLLAMVMLTFGAGYCCLVCFFADSIEARYELSSTSALWSFGGVENLFALHSAIFGWVAVVASERRTGIAGLGLLLISLPSCLAAIAGGFASAHLIAGGFPDGIGMMLAYCLVFVTGASLVRSYLGGIR